MKREIQLASVLTRYQQCGSGDPVVLLHGGMSDSRDFDGNLRDLEISHRVYLPDRRGHGRTADVDGPITIANMATDTIEFVEDVTTRPVSLVGYSAGAGVALAVAVARPDLLASLVLISGAYDLAGLIVKPDPTGEWPPAVMDAYAEVSPDGRDHFPVVAAKVATGVLCSRPLTRSDLQKVLVPSLVVAADDDLVTLEHTIDLYRSLPDGYLAIVPGATHLLLQEHPKQLRQLVDDFVSGRRGPRLMPMTRLPQC